MDPVSAALSVAGLLGLVSTCLDVLDLIDSTRAFGKAYMLLAQKFDNQRYRLITWAKATYPSPDAIRPELVEEQGRRDQIANNLGCIALLFEDESRLKRKYGLGEDKHASLQTRGAFQKEAEQFRDALRNASGQTSQTLEDSKQLSLLTTTNLQEIRRRVNIMRQTQWAVRDHKKFEGLVQDLKDFVDGLEDTTKDLGLGTGQRIIVEEDVAKLTPQESALVSEAAVDYGDVVSSAASLRRDLPERVRQRGLNQREFLTAINLEDLEGLTAPQGVISVLFVDLGNSARSPMAEAIFKRLTENIPQIGVVDSAGTGNSFHIQPTHYLSVATLYRHGIINPRRQPRQITPSDFDNFTYILAMDQSNVKNLIHFGSMEKLGPAKVRLFGDNGEEVHDPYNQDMSVFEKTFDQLERLSRNFLRHEIFR